MSSKFALSATGATQYEHEMMTLQEEASAILADIHPELTKRVSLVKRRTTARLEASDRVRRAQIIAANRRFAAEKKQAEDEEKDEIGRLKQEMLTVVLERQKKLEETEFPLKGVQPSSTVVFREQVARKLRRREMMEPGPEEYVGDRDARAAKRKEQIANIVFELSQEDKDADVNLFRSYAIHAKGGVLP
eukprot:ANDGO_07928.mRNA.1 hypothetical protein